MSDNDKKDAKVKCPKCGKLLSPTYIKTHLKKQHSDDKDTKKEKEKAVKEAAVEILTRPPPSYVVPDTGSLTDAELDMIEQLEAMDLGDDVNDAVTADIFGSESGTSVYFEQFLSDHTASQSRQNKKNEDAKEKRMQPEAAIQKKMEKKTGGQHQSTPAGIIDILTPPPNAMLIEIKDWRNWKAAIGQVYAYGVYYPNHMKCIHFFGKIPDADQKTVIISICTTLGIKVTYESDRDTQ